MTILLPVWVRDFGYNIQIHKVIGIIYRIQNGNGICINCAWHFISTYPQIGKSSVYICRRLILGVVNQIEIVRWLCASRRFTISYHAGSCENYRYIWIEIHSQTKLCV